MTGAAASAENATDPVAPNSSAEPYSKKPDAIELRMRYLSADSRAVWRIEIAHRQYSASESSSRPKKTVIRFAAPAISIAPLALHSSSAVVPPTWSERPTPTESSSAATVATITISLNTIEKPPCTNAPPNAA